MAKQKWLLSPFIEADFCPSFSREDQLTSVGSEPALMGVVLCPAQDSSLKHPGISASTGSQLRFSASLSAPEQHELCNKAEENHRNTLFFLTQGSGRGWHH